MQSGVVLSNDQSDELTDPEESFRLAKQELKNTNIDKSTYYLQLTLFLSKNNKDPNKIRGNAHNLLGFIYFTFMNQVNHEILADILGHFKISVAYHNIEDHRKNLQIFCDYIDSIDIVGDLREELDECSSLLHLKNGLIITSNQVISLSEVTDIDFQYPDPRKDASQNSALDIKKQIFNNIISNHFKLPKSYMSSEKMTSQKDTTHHEELASLKP